MSDADRIKEGRLAMGITQLDLAERLGVTIKTVNNWENGRHKPSPNIRKLINRIFDFHIGRRASKGFIMEVNVNEPKTPKKPKKVTKYNGFNIEDIFL